MSATFNVGVNPSALAITPDNRWAYVCNSNNYEIKNEDTVTVLDLKKCVPKLTLHDASFVEPYRLATDGEYVYVCNSGSPATAEAQGTVSVIEIKTNTVTGIIPGFDGPGNIALYKDRAYVTNYGAPGGVQSGNGKTVSVVDLKGRKIIHTITVPQAPAAVAVSPNGLFIYVISYVDGEPGTGILSVIDVQALQITASIPGLSGPFSLILSKECIPKYAYVSNFGSNNFAPFGTTVSVIDLRRHRIKRNITVGIQPSGLALSPNGDYLFVSNYNTLYAKANFQNLTPGEGTVNIIYNPSRKGQVISPTIPVGQSPSTITLSPDGQTLFVCQYVQNTVMAICLQH